MINFFRHFRKSLIENKKIGNYFKYAIGEIILIMVGIFMALQLQNWNENRKKDKAFNAALEQLYNSIKTDSEHYFGEYKNTMFHLKWTDTLLLAPKNFEVAYIPFQVYGLTYINNPYESESVYYIDDLEANAHTKQQKLITKEILKYLSLIKRESLYNSQPLKDLLQQAKILSPKSTVEGWVVDTTYYTKEELQRVFTLVINDDFQYILKNMRNSIFDHQLFSMNKHYDAESVRKLIKTHYPNVRILYTDIGIIGTSLNGFEGEGVKSTPMLLTNEDESIWEIDIYLKQGEVKFRARDSWAQNWGSIPKNADKLQGKGIQDGKNIIIREAGTYHVVLNLTTNIYKFTKHED